MRETVNNDDKKDKPLFMSIFKMAIHITSLSRCSILWKVCHWRI